MQVGEGVIIDGSKLGLNGGQLVGVVEKPCYTGCLIHLPRKVEQEMPWPELQTRHSTVYAYYEDIIATIPDCGHWLGKEML